MKSAVALCFVVFCSARAEAYSGYCSKPSEPYCVESYASDFSSQVDFDSCKMEVESYIENVKRYKKCMADELEGSIDEINKEANEVIEQFNCKARGDSYCF